MSAHLLGGLFNFNMDRMFVLLHQSSFYLFRYIGVTGDLFVVGNCILLHGISFQGITLTWILAGKSLGALYLVHAAVGTGRGNIVLDMDRFSLFGADHGHGVLTVLEVGNLLAPFRFQVGRDTYRLAVHGYQVVHLVAPVDVKHLAGGSHAVRGVDVAPVFLVVLHAPVAFVLFPEIFQHVDIGTLGIEDLSKYSLLGHVECGQFKEVVHAVFELHAVLLGAFGRIDDVPDLLQRHGGGNFAGSVLPLLHGIDQHRGVMYPVGRDIYQIDILPLAEFLPGLFAAAVCCGAGKTGLLEYLL